MTSGKARIGVGAAIVAGVLYYLFPMGGWKSLPDLVSPQPSIEIRSAMAPLREHFAVKEKLRLRVQHVETQKVLWMFDEDEKSIKSGLSEIEHVFESLPLATKGASQTRRVDAFVNSG